MERPYAEWFGQELVLANLQSPLYRGKNALCVGYDNKSERLIVWVLMDVESSEATTITGNEITVDPTKCGPILQYTVEDCKREVRQRKRPAVEVETNASVCCSICLEEPRNPIEFPCRHCFCSACIARLRPPRQEDFQWRCPNCRQVMPTMSE